MGFFDSSEELQRCIGALCDIARSDERIAPKIVAARIVVRFNYQQPNAVLTINAAARSAEPGFFFDATWDPNSPLKPDVEMTMTAEVAHRFWHGKLNLLTALGRGDIVARGPITKILRLLPAIEPLYTIYPQTLRALGRQDLVLT